MKVTVDKLLALARGAGLTSKLARAMHAAQIRRWRRRNPRKAAAARRRWRKAHSDKKRAQNIRWRKRWLRKPGNRARASAYNRSYARAYYAKNRQRLQAYNRRRYRAQKLEECFRAAWEDKS